MRIGEQNEVRLFAYPKQEAVNKKPRAEDKDDERKQDTRYNVGR